MELDQVSDLENLDPGQDASQESVGKCEEETERQLDYFHIMDLPEELRGKIFNFIPQESVIGLRLVCKQWCSEIDKLYNFDGIINDEMVGWERILNLRLVSCKIISFYKNPPNYGLPATKIFKYPHLLRSLNTIHENSTNISPSNLFYILSDYGSNLKEMSLYFHVPILLADFTSSLSTFNLQNLVRLTLIVSITQFSDLGININPPQPPQHINQLNSADNTTFDQLMRNPLPSLKYANFELRLVGGRTISKILGSLFVFLASRVKYSGTDGTSVFEELDLQIIQGHHGFPNAQAYAQAPQPLQETDAGLINMQELKELKSLKHLRIVSSSSIGVSLWLDLLQRQNNLISLEVDLIPVAHQLYANVISNNYTALVHLEITDLTVWRTLGGVGDDDNEDYDDEVHQLEPDPFDLTILQPCTNLKRLILDRNVIARREFQCAELRNLISLPNTLEELALNFFNVYTNDFYLYFSSLKLRPAGECKLTNVAITQCGTSGDYGVNGSVLEKLLSLSSILFVEISRLNFGTGPNSEEAIKLNRILTDFGYRENHSYFQYSKIQSILNELGHEHMNNVLNET